MCITLHRDMNSSQLLVKQMNSIDNCSAYNTLVGPTGPRGPSETIPGALKAFTIFVDYSGASAISRVYIPPYLFGAGADARLPAGGVFTGDVGTDLVFLGLNTVTIRNTNYAFVSTISVSGYVSGGSWQTSNYGRIATGYVYHSSTADYLAIINALDAANTNGGNTTTRPSTGSAAGFLAAITIFYM
jgi:hypothetical protein